MTGFNGSVLSSSMQSFQSKADALHYAIEFTATLDCAGCRKADYEAAQELYDFICRNVQLPDVTPNPFEEFMRNLKDGLVPGIPEPDKKKDVN